jgi:hypothetical protein
VLSQLAQHIIRNLHNFTKGHFRLRLKPRLSCLILDLQDTKGLPVWGLLPQKEWIEYLWNRRRNCQHLICTRLEPLLGRRVLPKGLANLCIPDLVGAETDNVVEAHLDLERGVGLKDR